MNVFIGPNGSGKSNLLEALGILACSANGRVDDQALLLRGVRPGLPALYKTAFPARYGNRLPPHLFFGGSGDAEKYEVSLHNPLKDPAPAWRFKTELWEVEGDKNRRSISSSGQQGRSIPGTCGTESRRIVVPQMATTSLDYCRIT